MGCGHRYCCHCLDQYERSQYEHDKNGGCYMIDHFRCPYCNQIYGDINSKEGFGDKSGNDLPKRIYNPDFKWKQPKIICID